jgi:hypothetical protein
MKPGPSWGLCWVAHPDRATAWEGADAVDALLADYGIGLVEDPDEEFMLLDNGAPVRYWTFLYRHRDADPDGHGDGHRDRDGVGCEA